jgi:hypothetical protein
MVSFLKSCSHMLICFSICMAIYVTPCPAESLKTGEIRIITLQTIISLTGNVATGPAEWDSAFSAIPDLKAGECLTVLFSREGLHPFVFKSGFQHADVILISKSYRIAHVFEKIRPEQCYSGTRPISAMIVLPDGFCHENDIQIGHYVDLTDLSPKSPLPSRQEDTDRANARTALERNLILFPDDLTVRENLGDFYLGTHDFESAQKTFQDLIRIEPTALRFTRLAQAQAASGNIPGARSSLEQANVLDPRSILSYVLLKKLARSQDERNAAITHMQSTLDKFPDFDELRSELAHAFLMNEQFDEGLAILEFKSPDEKRNAQFQRIRCDILLRKGEFRAAAEACLAYLQVCPYDPYAPDLRAFITVHKFRKESLGL